MKKFRYLGVTVTNTNDIREEIKRRINMGNACYYSLEKILSSCLLSKKLKVNTYKTIFGTKRDEITGEWRKLHNAELHALYFSASTIRNLKSRRLRLLGHVAHMDQYRNAYRVLVEKSEGKKPLRRPRHRWGVNIEMDLREVGCDAGD